jgi:hypothetical protein
LKSEVADLRVRIARHETVGHGPGAEDHPPEADQPGTGGDIPVSEG